MNTLALIPARAGSKGIPGKNFRELGGIPLWAHAMLCAWMGGAQQVVISSDAPGPRECSGTHGSDNIWLPRPSNLAQDDTPMLAVVQHALQQIPGPPDQIIVLLQPTQPFRTPQHVQQAITLLREAQADSVVSVVELPKTHAPECALRFDPDGDLCFASRDFGCDLMDLPKTRQEIPPTYIRDGTVYAFWRKTVDKLGSIYGYRSSPLIIPAAESCELDTEADWAEAERRWRAARELSEAK